MAIKDGLLMEFEQEMANTRKTLERVPDGNFAWKPHEKSMTLGRLASHVAEIPGWGHMTMSTESLDLAPPGAPPYQPQTATSTKELLASFDKHVVDMRGVLAAADEDYMKPWSLLMTGKTIFTMPKIAVLRGMVMNHLIHHRAQLGVYLRLNNVPLPPTYGPSADEQGGF